MERNVTVWVIYSLHDWGFWEAAAFRNPSGLGDFHIPADRCFFARCFNRIGAWRAALYCVSDFDCDWDYRTALQVRIEAFIEG